MPARTKLLIKFLEGPKKGLKMHFSIEQMPLLIGRHKSNHLAFEQDSKMSRFQCRFDYTGHKWVISDGRNFEAPSENGTWVFCMEDERLSNNDTIKAGNSIFKININ